MSIGGAHQFLYIELYTTTKLHTKHANMHIVQLIHNINFNLCKYIVRIG